MIAVYENRHLAKIAFKNAVNEHELYWEKHRFELWLEKAFLTEKCNYTKQDMIEFSEKAWVAACKMWEHQTF